MNQFIRILTAVGLTFGLAGPMSMAGVLAQSSSQTAIQTVGSVSGTAHESSGAPIANAYVKLQGAQTHTTTTDAGGVFSFASVAPGIYSLTVHKAGYETATDPSITVLADQSSKLDIVMNTITFSSLRTIAAVRAAGRGTFNTTPASVSVVSSQTFTDQAQPQVMQVLNQTPGIVASFPQTSANGAAPGAITFPNIRGSLSFETASLVDGHPVSVGTYGDYVTTFLNAFSLGGVEVVKGPGADAPEVNYAIGGTVNFRTKDPTIQPNGNFTLGYGSYGSSLLNFGFSNTEGKLSYVVDYTDDFNPGPINNYQAMYAPGGHNTYLNYNPATGTGTFVNYNDGSSTVPGTASSLFNNFQLVACCQPMNSTYESKSELMKFRYKLSSATTATFAYLGSQTTADQNGNTSSQIPGTFAPYAQYSGSLAPGPVMVTNLFPGTETETNNEPMFEGDIRTTIGNDTLLGRFYHASIYRLVNQGGLNPWTPDTQMLQLFGTNGSNKATAPDISGFVPVTYFDYYRQNETDKLGGASLEWNHPWANNNVLTFSVDNNTSSTTSYSISPKVPFSGPMTQNTIGSTYSVTVPTGSKQDFTTYMLRNYFQVGSKLGITWANYFNTYRNTYPTNCANPVVVAPNPVKQCLPDGTGFTFATANSSHYDPRLDFAYRLNQNTALRFSAGSAIAPPYLALLSTVNGTVSWNKAGNYATQKINSGTLLPETAFGYDLGGDYRFKDGVTVLSGDVYRTNLFNHFIAQTYNSGFNCPDAVCGAGNNVPLYYQANVNLSNSRFEGLELSLRRNPAYGVGYVLQGALERGYAYNLPACFYSANNNCAALSTNLAIVPNANFTGGALGATGGLGYNGFSNQNVPYLQGYGQLSYRFHNGLYAQVGETVLGKNNALNVPPFGILSATVRAPLANGLAVQVTGFNLTNAWSGLFPIQGAGNPIPLANGTLGATTQNVIGPSTVRVLLIKNFGEGSNPTP